jgi:HAMP domain-containing protein
VQGAGGAVAGVLGAHFDWRWLVENLKGLEAPGVDLLLLSRDRVVLFGPPDLVNKPLTVGSAQAANRVATAVLDERWPDGKDYVTVVIPTVGHGDLPSFGWSLLIRQDMDAALGPTRQLARSFWTTLGAGALVALALLYAGAAWVTAPLKRLVGMAEGLVDGSAPQAPRGENRFAEVERLTSALIRIQSRLLKGMVDRAASPIASAPERAAQKHRSAV